MFDICSEISLALILLLLARETINDFISISLETQNDDDEERYGTSDDDDDDDEIHLEYVSKPGHFPSEVAFVPKTSSTYEDDGFLVFLEYSAIRHASDVVVLDAKSMPELFRWEAPYHVPYTFHGHWEKNS